MKRSVTIKAAWITAGAVMTAGVIGLLGRSGSTTNVGGDEVAGDKVTTTNVQGDYVAGDKNTIILSDPALEARVRLIEARQHAETASKYPGGAAVFGVTNKGFVVPQGLVSSDVTVFWKTGSIHSLSDKEVVVRYPDMIYKGARIEGLRTPLARRVGARAGRLVWLGQFCPQAEIIGIDGDLVIVALGFPGMDKTK